MKKIFFAASLGLFFFSLAASSEGKVYHIASLNTADQFVDAFEGFKSRMTELGYRQGREVRYDFYNAKGSDEALQGFAQKLVQEKVDLIVTSSTTATVAAAKATDGTNIPVVFLSAGNPQKLVKSLSGSGNNLAGISSAALEITGKRFELLRILAPKAKRMATFSNPKGVNHQATLNEVEAAAKRLGFVVAVMSASSREEVARAAAAVTRKNADVIYTAADSVISDAIDFIVQQSIKERLPTSTALLANIKKGCLATYGADYFALGQQGAFLVDKILKGAKPADLPVEQPTKLKLAINLKTAKAIGVDIPKELLIRADELIE